MTAPNTIHLAGDFRREEALANAALTPGHVVELMSTGKIRKHATAGGYGQRMVAVEDALQGRTISDAYEADELASYNICAPGSESYVYQKAGSNVAVGALMISAGDGTLIENGEQASGVTVRQILAVALEASDLSASGAVATRIKVRWL